MTVLPEERVIARWTAMAAAATALVTEGGGPVTVLAPGRRNDDHGPDFRDAVLATRHGLVIGDIEVHTLSSGWWAHGHDRDPAYNRVVLHVVHRHDAGRDAALANGRTAPTLVLEGRDEAAEPALPPVLPDVKNWLPCRLAGRSPDEAGALLDGLGRERFAEHMAAFGAAFAAASGDVVLYAGLLRALGYGPNRDAMARLAAGVPLDTLARVPAGGGEAARLAAAEGVLIGAAGLLPSQRTRRAGGDAGHPWVRRLEAAWQAHGGAPVLGEADWRHAGVRPGNFPVRRLAAMARLLARYRDRGLAGGILGGLAAAGKPADMAALVTVAAEGYWRDHLDFGLAAAGSAPALCGGGRAADIIVNVVLPFAAAWRRRAGDEGGKRAAEAVYGSYPALADNRVIGEVRETLGLARPRTAVRQQGMLRLYRDWCRAGKCRTCRLG